MTWVELLDGNDRQSALGQLPGGRASHAANAKDRNVIHHGSVWSEDSGLASGYMLLCVGASVLLSAAKCCVLEQDCRLTPGRSSAAQ